jgi:hypothetical protein
MRRVATKIVEHILFPIEKIFAKPCLREKERFDIVYFQKS